MNKKTEAKPFVDLIIEIAQIEQNGGKVSKHPDFVEGKNYLSLYIRPDLSLEKNEFKKMMKQLILKCAEDLARGGNFLCSGTAGIQFYENKWEIFVSEFEEPPLGTVFVRVALKELAAFDQWKKIKNFEIPQDKLHCCLLFLGALLARFI